MLYKLNTFKCDLNKNAFKFEIKVHNICLFNNSKECDTWAFETRLYCTVNIIFINKFSKIIKIKQCFKLQKIQDR